MKLRVGDTLPTDIELPDQRGTTQSLEDLRAGHSLVLYFYPRDDTPGCTAQACSFRDQFQDFSDAGAVVVGVSDDGPEAHQRFAERHRLPFTLLADTGGRLRRRLGVPKSLGIIPGRVTYVIDKEGTVRHLFNSQTQATRHVSEALDVLRSLS